MKTLTLDTHMCHYIQRRSKRIRRDTLSKMAVHHRRRDEEENCYKKYILLFSLRTVEDQRALEFHQTHLNLSS